MGKIIKIHGCSGAGKTTAVREFMKEADVIDTVKDDKDKVEAYQLFHPMVMKPIFALGSYENTCGGMDTVGSAAEVMALLDKYRPLGHIIFEGLLQSTYYGKMGTHSRQFSSDYIYAFLDTPIELCLERIVARRAASGRDNKFNPQLTRDKHATIEALRRKLNREDFHRTEVLRHDQPMVPQLLELLK